MQPFFQSQFFMQCTLHNFRFHCLYNFFIQVTVGHYVQCVGFKPKELVKHHWSNWMRQTKRPWPLYLKDFWNNMMIDVLCHKWLPFIIKEKYLIPLDVLKWFVIINWNQYIEQFFCTAVRLLWISNFPAQTQCQNSIHKNKTIQKSLQ